MRSGGRGQPLLPLVEWWLVAAVAGCAAIAGGAAAGGHLGRADALRAPDCCARWSPSGSELFFIRWTPAGSETWLAAADGKPKRRVTVGVPLSWAPDGKALLVARSGSIVAVDGRGRVQTSIAGASEATWSPGSDRFAVSRRKPDDSLELVVASLRGGSRVLGAGFSPAWSPDARRLAFVRHVPSPDPAFRFFNAVFTIDLETGQEQQLTTAGAIAAQWSPSGSHLAYVQEEFDPTAGDTVDVAYVVDLARLQKVRLGRVGRLPIWSPAGDRLAVASVSPATLVFDLAGRQLATIPDSLPVEWTPDGGQILVQRGQTPGETPTLLLARADGTQVTLLARGFDADLSPDGKRVLFSTVGCGPAQGVFHVAILRRTFTRVADGCTTVGTNGRDALAGSSAVDRIFGRAGADTLRGGAGADSLDGGSGRDSIFGGSGDDVVRARDGERDTIDCGPGKDGVVADPRDRTWGCEYVRRR